MNVEKTDKQLIEWIAIEIIQQSSTIIYPSVNELIGSLLYNIAFYTIPWNDNSEQEQSTQ